MIGVTKKGNEKENWGKTLAGRRFRREGLPLCVPPCPLYLRFFNHRGHRGAQGKSTPEKIADGLLHYRTADLGNGLGERNILGTDFHAVLGIAAFLNPAIAHQRR